jgi:hypothetical protein
MGFFEELFSEESPPVIVFKGREKKQSSERAFLCPMQVRYRAALCPELLLHLILRHT